MTCYHPVQCWLEEGRDQRGSRPITFSRAKADLSSEMKIPCGGCIGCRIDRSKKWAIRCVNEASLHKENSFVTLTYNNEKLDEKCGILDDHDGIINQWSLNAREFQLFVKRLRKKTGKKIRYYHCGEYGDLYSRPHHHVCFFGLDFPDKQAYKKTSAGTIYQSKELEEIWGNGFCVVGEVTYQSAAYVARYIMKKITGIRAADHYGGRMPEYTTMSRKPGIGADWIKRYCKDVFRDDILVHKGKRVPVPRYYDNYLRKEDEEQYEQVKLARKENAKKYSDDRLAEKEDVVKGYLKTKQKRQYETGVTL